MKKIINVLFYIALFSNIPAHSDVVTDGSVGVKTTLTGTMTIPQNLGTTMGNNLFHSFNSFNINTGESVKFTGSDLLMNVISRVTGGHSSTIDGLLQSTIGQANFYFINPAGVSFGANAQLDVPAAFHVSTANTLRFTDGSLFSASIDSNSSQLSIAEPASFGFLANSPANSGSITINGSVLSVLENKTLDVVANNIIVQNTAELIAPAGEVRLVAVNGLSEVNIQSDNLNHIPLPAATPSTTNSGSISIDSSRVNSDGNGGGFTALWGGNIDVINTSAVSSRTFGTESGTVVIKSNLLNIFKGSIITTTTIATGNAGNIDVTANKLNIDGQNSTGVTGISSSTTPDINDGLDTGNGGTITVNVGDLTIQNGGRIRSSSFSNGHAGSVNVTANTFKIDKQGSQLFTGIQSRTSDGSGNAGTIEVAVKEFLTLSNGAQISSSNISTGNAGTVSVTSPQIALDHNSFITTTAETGHGGDIIINAEKLLSLQNSGFLTSVSGADSNGGDINVLARILVMDNGVIQANAVGGNGGNINLDLQGLIPSNNLLTKGGAKVLWQPYQAGFNVIQAASENGVNGTVNDSSPQFNISGSLTGLSSAVVLPVLVSDPCLSSAALASSLARGGKGGIAATEAKTIFVPAIPTQPNSGVPSQVKPNSSSLTENRPCAPL